MGSQVTSLRVINADDRLLSARVSAFLCDPHLHNTYTIGLMRRGVTRFGIRGRSFTAAPGDAFLIHPFEVHAGGDGVHGIEYDVLYPTAQLMGEAAQIRLAANEFPYFDTVVLPRSELVDRLFAAVDRQREPSAEGSSDAAVEQAIIEAFGQKPCDARTTCLPREELMAVQAACELMQEFHQRTIDFSELNERVGMSRFHFIRVFHRATGLTPSAFLRQLRLSRARDLIAGGGELADVAADVGFADQAHMTREFKKTYGFTPGQLMRSVKDAKGITC